MSEAEELVLATAFRHVIDEPTVEAGFERFQALAGAAVEYGAFRDAVDSCVREGLVRDPVRLEEGALQCHWRLELTAAGVERARGVRV